MLITCHASLLNKTMYNRVTWITVTWCHCKSFTQSYWLYLLQSDLQSQNTRTKICVDLSIREIIGALALSLLSAAWLCTASRSSSAFILPSDADGSTCSTYSSLLVPSREWKRGTGIACVPDMQILLYIEKQLNVRESNDHVLVTIYPFVDESPCGLLKKMQVAIVFSWVSIVSQSTKGGIRPRRNIVLSWVINHAYQYHC